MLKFPFIPLKQNNLSTDRQTQIPFHWNLQTDFVFIAPLQGIYSPALTAGGRISFYVQSQIAFLIDSQINSWIKTVLIHWIICRLFVYFSIKIDDYSAGA